ncbi:hypothetical protein T4B_7046 [Trichinella pseudospiralis]|uniref:Methyl methanesulfonate-sensitivity protein 22-like n=1 Tax=Trichinella pseudospiralis TaxID=6337 RepID=A0A0V1IKV8_TRIPS|nr:hypothetical protein T4B_7046 [Trichinella pseudospiralis]
MKLHLLNFTFLFPLYSSSVNETKELSNSFFRFVCPENTCQKLFPKIMSVASRIRRRAHRTAFVVSRWQVCKFRCSEYGSNGEHLIFSCNSEIMKRLFNGSCVEIEVLDDVVRSWPLFDVPFTGIDDLLRKEMLESLVKKFMAEMNKTFPVTPEAEVQLTKKSVCEFRRHTQEMLLLFIDIVLSYPTQNIAQYDVHPVKVILRKIASILYKIGCLHQPPITSIVGNKLDEDMKSLVIHTFLEIWWLLLSLTYAIKKRYPEEDRNFSLRMNSIVSGMKSFHGEVKILLLYSLTMFTENHDKFEKIVLAPCNCVEQMWLLLDMMSNHDSLTFFEWLESNKSSVKFFTRLLDRDSRNTLLSMQRQPCLRLALPRVQPLLEHKAYRTMCWSFVYGIAALLAKHCRPLTGSKSAIWALLNSTALKNVYTILIDGDIDEIDVYLRRYLFLVSTQFPCYDSVGIFFWDVFKKMLPVIEVTLESYTGVDSCFQGGLKWWENIQALIDQPFIALERKHVGIVDRFMAIFILHLKVPNGDQYRAKFKSRMVSLLQSRSPIAEQDVNSIFLLANLLFHFCAINFDSDFVDEWILQGLDPPYACFIEIGQLKHFWTVAMLYMKLRRGGRDHFGCEALGDMIYETIHSVMNRFLCITLAEQRQEMWKRVVVYFEALSLLFDNLTNDCEKQDIFFVKINFEQLVQEAKKHNNLVEADVKSMLVLFKLAYTSIKVWPALTRDRLLAYELTSSKALMAISRDYNHCPGLGAAWYAYLNFVTINYSGSEAEMVASSLVSRFASILPNVAEIVDLMTPLLYNERLIYSALPVRLMMSQRITLTLFYQCWLFGYKFEVPASSVTHMLNILNSRMDLGIVAADLLNPGFVCKRTIDRVGRMIDRITFEKRSELKLWLLQWAVPSAHAAIRQMAIMLYNFNNMNESLLNTIVTGLCYLFEHAASMLVSWNVRNHGAVNHLYTYFLDVNASCEAPLRRHYPELLEKLESAVLFGMVRGNLETDIGLIHELAELVKKVFFRPDFTDNRQMRSANIPLLMKMITHVKERMSERKYHIVRNLLFTEIMKRTVEGRQGTSADVEQNDELELQLMLVNHTAKFFNKLINFDREISFLLKTDYLKWCASCYMTFYPEQINELNTVIELSLSLLINPEGNGVEPFMRAMAEVSFALSCWSKELVNFFFKFILDKLPIEIVAGTVGIIGEMIFNSGQSTERLRIFQQLMRELIEKN